VSSPTPHRFDHPIWTIRDVLGWVLDRDPSKFGRLFTEEDTKSALFRVHIYKTTWPRPECDPQVLTTVLHALQRSDLRSYDGTNSVPRDFWTDKTPQYVRDATRFLFRREDVLALWRDPRARSSQETAPIESPPSPREATIARATDSTISQQPDAGPKPVLRYTSERERARRYYRKLSEWVEIVQVGSNCDDPTDARRQILDGLSDGKFAVRWEEDDGRQANPELSGDPPSWHQAKIDWATGKVYCDQSLTEKGRAANLARWLIPLLSPKMASVFERMLAGYRNSPVSPAPAPIGASPLTKSRRGPAKGSLDRYGEADLALFPELERIQKAEHLSLTAAALKLAEGHIEGKNVIGSSTPLSRAKRLVERYNSTAARNRLKFSEGR